MSDLFDSDLFDPDRTRREIFGGTVAAIEVTDEKLQLAKDLGAVFKRR